MSDQDSVASLIKIAEYGNKIEAKLKAKDAEIERLTARIAEYETCCNLNAIHMRDQDKRIAELEAKNGKLITVFYAADAFMQCPTENYLELSNLAETLREAIKIASDTPDSFDDLVESGGLPEAQALAAQEKP